MSDRFPALGFDPAPGDVAAVDALCAAVQRTLETLVRIRAALHSFGDPGAVWRGEAARAFAGELGDLSPYLEQAEQSHRVTHRALASWADDLQRRQRAARALEDAAEVAQRSLLAAGQVAERAAAQPVRAGDEVGAQLTASAALHRLAAAEQELADVRARARRLHAEHEAEAAQAAAAVRAAADVAPVEPGAFERLASAVVATAAFPFGVDDRLADWCQQNAHVLGELADVLADATAVAGAVALLVPCPATAAVAVALALATLGTRAVSDAAGADVAASTYLLDGVSVGAGVVGGVAALGIRGGLSTLAQGKALGHGGQVLAGEDAVAHYGRLAARGDVAGNSGSITSTGTGLAQSTGDDRPFLHAVPDSRSEVAAGVLLGPAGTALVSAVDLGRAKDRGAAAQAERNRWNR